MKLSKEAWIITAIAIIFVVVLVGLIWKSSSFVPNPNEIKDTSLLVRPTSHMTGKPEAKVTIVEFGDFECPACAATYPLLKQTTEKYKDNPDFNFVFRNFPLPQHAYAKAAAEAAEAAGAQGKYWQMHDALYEGWKNWEGKKEAPQMFVTYAETLGLDVAKFQKEVNSNAYQSVINADLSDVNKLGLDHTPTVFINGVEQADLTAEALTAKIDSLLSN